MLMVVIALRYNLQQLYNNVVSFQAYMYHLRTFARNFSNIDFFLKILPVKVDELVMSKM